MGMAAIAVLGASLFGTLTYSHDIKPITDNHCIECHSPGGRDPDLSQFPFQSPTLGNEQAIVAKILVMTQTQAGDAGPQMPPGARPKLSAGEVSTISTWQSQGLNP